MHYASQHAELLPRGAEPIPMPDTRLEALWLLAALDEQRRKAPCPQGPFLEDKSTTQPARRFGSALLLLKAPLLPALAVPVPVSCQRLSEKSSFPQSVSPTNDDLLPQAALWLTLWTGVPQVASWPWVLWRRGVPRLLSPGARPAAFEMLSSELILLPVPEPLACPLLAKSGSRPRFTP